MQYQNFTQKEIEILLNLVRATLNIPINSQITRSDLFSIFNKLEEGHMQADLIPGGTISVEKLVKDLPKEKSQEYSERLRDPASFENQVIYQTLKGCIKGMIESGEERRS